MAKKQLGTHYATRSTKKTTVTPNSGTGAQGAGSKHPAQPKGRKLGK